MLSYTTLIILCNNNLTENMLPFFQIWVVEFRVVFCFDFNLNCTLEIPKNFKKCRCLYPILKDCGVFESEALDLEFWKSPKWFWIYRRVENYHFVSHWYAAFWKFRKQKTEKLLNHSRTMKRVGNFSLRKTKTKLNRACEFFWGQGTCHFCSTQLSDQVWAQVGIW